MAPGLGIIDWNNVANAATAISSAAQGAASAYTSINNAINTPSNPAALQYLNPPAQTINVPAAQKDNTLTYIAIGGLGLFLVLGGVIFVVSRKKR